MRACSGPSVVPDRYPFVRSPVQDAPSPGLPCSEIILLPVAGSGTTSRWSAVAMRKPLRANGRTTSAACHEPSGPSPCSGPAATSTEPSRSP